MDTKSVLMAGVGGQGIRRASDIFSHVIIAAGLDVK
ncbi:MAG: indolepyruvate oxidoreductase subunit beta, partial [Proteobacteria bacterium]|nr:indolepyruvate oxidoreductase subunit beta [Pseudomonadota bacterium]